jgi:hypothetical protein
MQKDMKMTDVQWSAGISLFYGKRYYRSYRRRPFNKAGELISNKDILLYSVGYMISQLPGSMIISKYKPRIIMPAVM